MPQGLPQAANPAVEALADSWYEASARAERQPLAPLQTDTRTEVCVIGGGFAGLHTALELAEAGRRVVVLEARRIAWGASGRNGGQVIPEYACGRDTLVAALGETDGQACWGLAAAGAERLRERITKYGIDCDYAAGHLEAAISERRFARLRRSAASAVAQGRMRLVAGTELRALVGSPLYAGGLYDPDGGHLHPVKLALGLARAIGTLGGAVHESTPVARWEHDAGRIRVHCTGGQVVNCEQLVVAANVGVGSIGGPGMRTLAQRILPVGTWVIASASLSEDLAASVLPGGCAVADNRMIMDYFRLSRDRRLIFGGGCSYLGEATPRGFAEQLQRRMLQVFPQLHGVAVEYAWGGVLDISMNRAPDTGIVDGQPQVFYAQGFSGSGLVATCAVGTALAQALQGNGRTLGLLARVPHRRFPGGGLLRAPITAAGMLWHRALDLW